MRGTPRSSEGLLAADGPHILSYFPEPCDDVVAPCAHEHWSSGLAAPVGPVGPGRRIAGGERQRVGDCASEERCACGTVFQVRMYGLF